MPQSKTLHTRIKQKIDTYQNWTANNPVLLEGEIAVVVVPASSGAVTQEPAILFKIGAYATDGVTLQNFNTLPFVSGLAADVHNWAKAASKPSYDASEIANLEQYISAHIQDTDTIFKIEVDTTNANKFALYSKPRIGEGNWTKVGADITIPDTNTTYSFVAATSGDAYITVTPSTGSVVDAKVEGLGTAAFSSSTDFATASHSHGNITNAGKVGSATGKVLTTSTGGTVVASDTISTSNVPSLDAGKITSGTFGVERIPNITLSKVTDAGDAAAKDVVTTVSTSTDLPTAGAVKTYVDNAVSGLSGAMHFIGQATVTITDGCNTDPVISGYDFSKAKSGDVIIGYNVSTEFVWTGNAWRQFGDESSYALKTTKINGKSLTGDITLTASDVSADASGTASGLINALDGSAIATAADGNQYSVLTGVTETNGVISKTSEVKLSAVAKTGAYSDIDGTPTSYSATGQNTDGFMTQKATTDALSGKQTTLTFDGTYNASSNKAATQSTVTNAINNLDGSATATAAADNKYYVLTGVSETNGVISKGSEVQLEAIAKTGNVNDLIQTSNEYIVFNCGTSTANV